MSLSKDGMTGHPTPDDPDPGQRRAVMVGFNRWPMSEEDQERATRTVSDERRAKLAEQNRERARRNARLKKILEIYDVPRPASVPGQKKVMFSRFCKEHECKLSKYGDLDSFVAHVIEMHGSAEKDKQLAELDDVIAGDLEERLAEDTFDALEVTAGPPGAVPEKGTPAGDVDYPVEPANFDITPEGD